jgi:hypothetical protein
VPWKPGHWKCPVKNQQGVGDCSFTDGQARKVEQQLPAIITKALVLEGPKADDWVNVTTKLEWILTTLRQREDFTDAQIDTMSLMIDKWKLSWIALNGKEGMTNYNHCLTAGHVVYYLKYWKNVYRYSNQGWEYFNWQYRYVYFHQTQRGGSSGTHGESGSKTKPIGLWFLRRLYWLSKGVDGHIPERDK